MVSYDQFIRDLNSQEKTLWENLSKYDKVKDFFEKRIRERLEFPFWPYNPLISMILFDRHGHLQDYLSVPDKYSHILPSIRKKLAGKYNFDYQITDVLQEITALKYLIENGYSGIDIIRGKSLKKPDFQCRRESTLFLVEVKNLSFKNTICDFLCDFLLTTLLFMERFYNLNHGVHVILAEGIEDIPFDPSKSAEYERQLRDILRTFLGLMSDLVSNPEQYQISESQERHLLTSGSPVDLSNPSSWMRLEILNSAGHLCSPAGPRLLEPEIIKNVKRKYRDTVDKAYNKQCLAYAQEMLSDKTDIRHLILMNIVYDGWLLLQEERMLSELTEMNDDFRKKYSNLEVRLFNLT